ncbi:PIR protein, putative [Plasmodium sp. DRC-Itaito]|nr:PIR protein, putative [Plasmodium sp. DRC-Itaito]
MKVHYINILLFAHALNILVHNKNKPSITPKIPTTRLLCECELYAPINYDNDPKMKEVMDNFDRQTSQRFLEYDERMKTTRQKCKEQCDKEIQKIILKDKLEKELMDKFAKLDTDIQSDAIPRCICEKSVADKVEKGCLRCGGILGSAVPELGAMGAIALYNLSAWYTEAIIAAKAAAVTKATALATKAGMNAVKLEINKLIADSIGDPGLFDLTKIVSKLNFNCNKALYESAMELANGTCIVDGKEIGGSFCNTILRGEKFTFKLFADVGATRFEETYASQKGILEAKNIAAVKTAYGGYNTSIIAPIIAIVVIVLVMVIIYLILRRRRKKKMKKKVQYIKLLEE